MERALRAVVCVFIAVGVCAHQPHPSAQTNVQEIHIEASIEAVVELTAFSGKVIPVDVDPNFALTLRVTSADPVVGPFTDGAVVTVAIHSPSLLFAGEPTRGKTYDLYLSHKVGDEKRFFALRVGKEPNGRGGQARVAYVTDNDLAITKTLDSRGHVCAIHIEPIPEPGESSKRISDEQLDRVLNELVPKEQRGKFVIATFLDWTCLEFVNNEIQVDPGDGCGGVSERYQHLTITRIGNSNAYHHVDVVYSRRSCKHPMR